VPPFLTFAALTHSNTLATVHTESILTMTPVLEDLPTELFEGIVQQLDLSDIYNLRLSSRLLASKATQHHFKSFFRKKRVNLDERSLTTFCTCDPACWLRRGGVGPRWSGL
jgi:hypothetical protein